MMAAANTPGSRNDWVIIRTVTDPSGAVDVTVVDVVSGPAAEQRARKECDRLNQTARQDVMEVYITRQVGGDGGPVP